MYVPLLVKMFTSLNPCSNGMPLNVIKSAKNNKVTLGLNPCSNGMPLNDAAKYQEMYDFLKGRLNPCSNGMPLNPKRNL